jgi:hypothetical protein
MKVDDRTCRAACRACGGNGEVRTLYDDVEAYVPCECRGGPPAGLAPRAIGYAIADPTRMREIFDALVATPDDGPLYELRQQVARAMATAGEHRHLAGASRLVERGMILDDFHRADLLSNFREPSIERARHLAELRDVVSHAPLRVRLSDA